MGANMYPKYVTYKTIKTFLFKYATIFSKILKFKIQILCNRILLDYTPILNEKYVRWRKYFLMKFILKVSCFLHEKNDYSFSVTSLNFIFWRSQNFTFFPRSFFCESKLIFLWEEKILKFHQFFSSYYKNNLINDFSDKSDFLISPKNYSLSSSNTFLLLYISSVPGTVIVYLENGNSLFKFTAKNHNATMIWKKTFEG